MEWDGTFAAVLVIVDVSSKMAVTLLSKLTTYWGLKPRKSSFHKTGIFKPPVFKSGVGPQEFGV